VLLGPLILSACSQAPRAPEVVTPHYAEPVRVTGTEHALRVEPFPEVEQHRRAYEALMDGQLPHFLEQWASVDLTHRDTHGVLHTGTAWVTVDYLSIGTDEDHLIVPLDLPTAMAIARERNAVLPTKRLVDAIWEQADLRVEPSPLPPTDEMRSMAYSLHHRDAVARQVPAVTQGLLIAGHKKDTVLTPDLGRRRERVAIYGWHRPNGEPIQPLSLWHGAHYSDYSHGVRLACSATKGRSPMPAG
jgi:hypothetical protein